ncbi:hypothetical protein M8494_00540 [Serratia ureilytica]
MAAGMRSRSRAGADQTHAAGFLNTRCVALDDRYGAWLATRHLIQQGHKRIAIICSTHQISTPPIACKAISTLQEHGIAVDEKLIANGEPDEIGGEQAMTELLGRGRSSPPLPATTIRWPPARFRC